ncbi:MAG: hypothetical protein P9M14_08395 [Candidatus Alcyoniella australis]|nr:hypothetical protein [Candidatus Alcyoniella australis]
MTALPDKIVRLARTDVFGPRRARLFRIKDVLEHIELPLEDQGLAALETIDFVYRTLCGVLYNCAPTSGHPGGSISSGRIVSSLFYGTMDYDFSQPREEAADMLVYAAGHKALGLYAMWALRNELIRIGAPQLLAQERMQLRWEDLLGFRRNRTQETPLFKKFNCKPLDGHPTPAMPFVSLATGASGVGVPAAFGLALAALDYFGDAAPQVNVLEGEGGMTPGRVHEALAAAATANLRNIVLHVDWNQASIDSNRVCADQGQPGDYVQWNPTELCYTHDWNVIEVEDGFDLRQVLAAQVLAKAGISDQPTAIVYRTIKGWHYGIEGRKSHGAGHGFCSENYFKYVAEPFEQRFGKRFPRPTDCGSNESIEQIFFETLIAMREALEQEGAAASFAVQRLGLSKERLAGLARAPRQGAPKLEALYSGELRADQVPDKLVLEPGSKATLRGALGDALNQLNLATGGALLACAADLADSTSISKAAKGLSEGFYNAATNPTGRLVAVGGICEDAMGGLMAGVSSFGRHIGCTSSYGAFIAALEHIIARLHGIGQQNMHDLTGDPFRTFIMVNAHAGIKTGEDGPTHADPQCLQLLQENFPRGILITLTPWEPQEVWPLLMAGISARPAVLCPFVTRPNEIVPDRAVLGVAPASAAIKGLYKLVAGDPDVKPYHGTLVLQGSEVGINFTFDVLPELRKQGINLNVYYVASSELFDLLPSDEQQAIFPEARAREAMGITGFTLPTIYRWISSFEGRKRTLHPFKGGRYLGSGKAEKVLEEGGLDSQSMLAAILDYARYIEQASS